MPETDESTPRYVAQPHGHGTWRVWLDNADAGDSAEGPACHVPAVTPGDDAEATARRIAAALNRDAAFDALVAAVRTAAGLFRGIADGRAIGMGVAAEAYNAMTDALKLAETP